MPETRSLCSGPTSAARSALQDVVLGGLGGDPLVACLKGEARAMVDDPEVQVELGAAGEGVEYALLPDHLRYRTVAVLVPVPQDFLGRDVAPPELGEPEAVRLESKGTLLRSSTTSASIISTPRWRATETLWLPSWTK